MYTSLTETQSAAVVSLQTRLLSLSREHWKWVRMCKVAGASPVHPSRMLSVRANMWGFRP